MYLGWIGRGSKLYRYLRGGYTRLKALQEQRYWNRGVLGKFKAYEGQEVRNIHSQKEYTYAFNSCF